MTQAPSASRLVAVEPLDGVALVRLNRPERRNALGADVVTFLATELARLDADPDVGAIVLTATAPGFCAGSDLKELAGSTITEMIREEDLVAALTRSIAALSKPVVAAVEGFAIGGGLMLAVACDVVVTAASTRWHLSEVSLGWFPPWGLAPLIDRVGVAQARRLTMAAEPMDGAEAAALGVADIVVPDGGADRRAVEVAQPLTALPRTAVASAKRFFAEHSEAAAMDRKATALFRSDVRSPEALASLARFGVLA